MPVQPLVEGLPRPVTSIPFDVSQNNYSLIHLRVEGVGGHADRPVHEIAQFADRDTKRNDASFDLTRAEVLGETHYPETGESNRCGTPKISENQKDSFRHASMVSGRPTVGKRKKPVFWPGDVTCPYCTEPAVLVDSKVVTSNSFGTKVWLCQPCKAWVWVHPGAETNAPMGRLANEELRCLKVRAQVVFNQMWHRGRSLLGVTADAARKAAYHWLAEQMGISVRNCQIGFLDEEQTKQVIEICMNPASRKET